MNFHFPSLSIGAIAAVILTAGGLFGYNKLHPAQSVLIQPKNELKGIQTETITKTIVVYKDAAKKKLDLPPEVQANTSDRVVGARKIPANSRPQTLSVVLNTSTGVTDMYLQTDPYPWLEREKRTTFSLDYGMKRTGLTWRLTGREDLLQVKAAHIGLVGSVDGDSTYFVGLGVSVSW